MTQGAEQTPAVRYQGAFRGQKPDTKPAVASRKDECDTMPGAVAIT